MIISVLIFLPCVSAGRSLTSDQILLFHDVNMNSGLREDNSVLYIYIKHIYNHQMFVFRSVLQVSFFTLLPAVDRLSLVNPGLLI